MSRSIRQGFDVELERERAARARLEVVEFPAYFAMKVEGVNLRAAHATWVVDEPVETVTYTLPDEEHTQRLAQAFEDAARRLRCIRGGL
ncbi:hypothetical protein SEA_LITTLETOKYO_54 [Arthrobacter phage LittleTokyo]|nr:hypothetical protein SEA_LITTLETOKYO_54 [Arthrobacter phage LittleTokyo]